MRPCVQSSVDKANVRVGTREKHLTQVLDSSYDNGADDKGKDNGKAKNRRNWRGGSGNRNWRGDTGRGVGRGNGNGMANGGGAKRAVSAGQSAWAKRAKKGNGNGPK